MAVRLAALKRRTSDAGIPSIYINDNFGQWRSDFRRTVAHCLGRGSRAGWYHDGSARPRETTSC